MVFDEPLRLGTVPPIENKNLCSTVETENYDVRVEIQIRHKRTAEISARNHAVELLGEISEQLKVKKEE